ncbi:hypothetical protein ES332_D01G186700v1 [Gossypium tomentosum]|uniref:GOST seven transmembrane domain-containing protein n=1 Tax=Gossypium tomentosum TaxID=34277 RepID=A0A5D2MAZ8_GOSTO|nr:hypothetical protein ES332_D01G186700v1 [Gossypium tomentosum]
MFGCQYTPNQWASLNPPSICCLPSFQLWFSWIYRKFTNALAVVVIISVGWICYEWQNAWIIPAFWQILSFSLLCVICVLWAPSQNSTRYAYSGEANEDFDKDDTNLTLIKPSPTHSKDFRTAPETRTVQGSNGASSNGDLEEDKTE